MKYPIILIDNGHGTRQYTKGKRSPDGTLIEGEYCRSIAQRVVDALEAKGLTAFRLVKEDEDIALSVRAQRANSYCSRYGARNVLLVSIHCNAAGNGAEWMAASGWEVWTTVGKTKSDQLATCLFEAAQRTLQGFKMRSDKSDGDPDKEKNFTIIYMAKCPAVLTENLFQDNRGDVAFLLSEEGRKAIVKLHVDGIIDYLEKTGQYVSE